MIIPIFSTFRDVFSIGGDATTSVTFADANPDTITRAAGNWEADGFEAGQRLTIVDSALNDGTYTIAVVTPTVITLVAADALVAEAVVTVTARGRQIDVDGYEVWPASNVRLASSGFGDTASTLTGIPVPYTGSSFLVSCNAVAADAAPGTDDYDWYFSQRTDLIGGQMLSIVQQPPSGGNTFSGTVRITETALAVSELGAVVADTVPQRTVDLFKHCDIYVRRISDEAIQWVNLFRAMTSSV